MATTVSNKGEPSSAETPSSPRRSVNKGEKKDKKDKSEKSDKTEKNNKSPEKQDPSATDLTTKSNSTDFGEHTTLRSTVSQDTISARDDDDELTDDDDDEYDSTRGGPKDLNYQITSNGEVQMMGRKLKDEEGGTINGVDVVQDVVHMSSLDNESPGTPTSGRLPSESNLHGSDNTLESRRSEGQMLPDGVKKDYTLHLKLLEARKIPPKSIRNQRRNPKTLLQKTSAFIMDVSNPNLMNMDITGATDPYCTIQLEKSRFRTRTIMNRLNPFWCEEFKFTIGTPSTARLVITCWAEEKHGPHQPIGKVVIPVNSLNDQKIHDQWYPMFPVQSKTLISGDIHIKLKLDDGNVIMCISEARGVSTVTNQADCKFQIIFHAEGGKSKELKGKFLDTLAAPIEDYDHMSIKVWGWKEKRIRMVSASVAPTIIAEKTTEFLAAVSSKKEKKFLGQVNISFADLQEKVQYDRWFALNPDMIEDEDDHTIPISLGDIRLKLRFKEEIVLQSDAYTEMLELLMEPKLQILQMLGETTKDRDDVARTAVSIFQAKNKVLEFLTTLTAQEIASTEHSDIIFRGNTFTTKNLDIYLKMVGMKYLHATLKPLIQRIYQSKRSCEVNPNKIDKGEKIAIIMANLLRYMNSLVKCIFGSADRCPGEMREIFHAIQQQVKDKYHTKDVEITKYTAVSGFLFLRFFCPAILGPKLFGLMDDHPSLKTSRTLLLMAKTLQNLANLIEAGWKEDYMKDMNKFAAENMEKMKHFIDTVSSKSGNEEYTYDGPAIYLERELACMYRHLRRNKAKILTLAEERKIQETPNIHKLVHVLDKLDARISSLNMPIPDAEEVDVENDVDW